MIPGKKLMRYGVKNMRSEKEMMELIIGIAQNDERVRAVYMNGSRTNPNAPKDMFQDYDIVYVVEETGSFIKDKNWPARFGDILIMQYPDESPFYPNDKENSYGWLMLFKDGNRIDLTVKSIEHAKENVLEDSLCIVLLDKDGILPPIPEASDETHRVRKPAEEEYASVCNEFWWCLNNVAKGLARGEVTYVQDMLAFVVRKQLETVLAWKIGELTDYSVSIGKSGKYMYRWLSEKEWNAYLATYCGCDIDQMRNSVDIMCRLFRETSEWVADKNGFKFNATEADNSYSYLNMVKGMK